jgi:NAD(P)-dependent dehydrogenase (short-subunit alcohol dehydrogenase family)
MKAVGSTMIILLLALSPAFGQAGGDSGQKAVLVTGASSGIGYKIAEVLAQNGFHVYAGARKSDDLARLGAMKNMTAVRLDVTVQEDIDAAVELVRSEGRGLWGIVNNAGVVRYSPLSTGAIEDVEFTFDVNFFGPVRINRAFLPMLIESGGRTATISSLNGFVADSGDGGYTASKFAVEGYTDSLALELADTGVHVAVVEPGAYKSRIRDKMVAEALASAEAGEFELGDEEREQLARYRESNESMKEPGEVADAVLHLMTSDAPKRRYMVAPIPEQAAITIRAALERVVQLNADQPYRYDRDELVALLDELLAE